MRSAGVNAGGYLGIGVFTRLGRTALQGVSQNPERERPPDLRFCSIARKYVTDTYMNLWLFVLGVS